MNLFEQVNTRQAELRNWLNAPLSEGSGDTFDFSGVSLRNLAHVDEDHIKMQDPDSALVETDSKKMSARFLISSIKKDSHGDTVIPQGCKNHLKRYEKNPVVFFGHKSYGLPIGSARAPETNTLVLDVADDVGVYSSVYFHGKTKESEEVFRLVEAKELRAASIGFMPILGKLNKKPDADENAPKNQVKFEPYYTFVFEEWELYEWSIVAVPANSDCIAMRLSKGFGGKKLSDGVENYLKQYAAPLKIWANGFVPEEKPASSKEAGINEIPVPITQPEPQWMLDFRKMHSELMVQLAKWLSVPKEVVQPAPAPVVETPPAQTDTLKELLADLNKLNEKVVRNEKSLRRITGKVD